MCYVFVHFNYKNIVVLRSKNLYKPHITAFTSIFTTKIALCKPFWFYGLFSYSVYITIYNEETRHKMLLEQQILKKFKNKKKRRQNRLILPSYINFVIINSTTNTAPHEKAATVIRLFPLYASTSATKNPTHAEMTDGVA